MNLLVTGSNGYIGSKLLESVCFGERYKKIYAVVRENSENAHIPNDARIEKIVYDGSVEGIQAAIDDSDYVIHLGAVYTTATTSEAVASLLKANIEFSVNVFQAVSKSDRKPSVVSTSTFSSFNEEYRYMPKSFYAATKSAVEVLAAGFPIKAAFVRLPDTYGGGDWRKKVHNLLRNAVLEKADEFAFQKPDYQIINMAHVDDVVRALLHTARITHEGENDVTFYDLFYPQNTITLGEVADQLIKGSSTAVSFPLFGDVDPLPPQRHLLPSFEMRYNPHNDLAVEVYKGCKND